MKSIGNIFCLLLFVLGFIKSVDAQIITTVAGTGIAGSFGDNGLAINAQLNSPAGIAFDKNGNLYVTETFSHRIRRIDALGIITTIGGIGTAGYNGDSILATNAQINFPIGIAVDTSGNIFLADVGNNRIRRITTSGVITTVAGNGSTGYNGDGIPATTSSVFQPHGITFDTLGSLYIADAQNNRIRKVTTNGIITTIAGTGIAGCFSDTALSSTLGATNAIFIDKFGNIYIADASSETIRKISTGMIMTTIAGFCSGIGGYNGDNIPAINAKVYDPWDIKMDSKGNFFIADEENNRIRKIDTSGIITTVVGTGVAGFSGDNGLATSAKISLPIGLVFDACDNLLFTDGSNHRIRKVWFNTDTIPQVSATITPNDTVITGTQVTTTATATNHGTVTSYQWVKNGANAGTNSAYTYTPVTGDSIYCIATVRACTGRMYTDTTTTIHITVNSGVGVANTTNYRTHTYPNPVIDVLQVETTEAQQYVLHNLMGVAILQGTVDKNNTIDFKAIPAGTYLLQLTNTQGQREVVRVVKE